MNKSTVEAFRTALTNWVWLAELAETRRALLVGDHAHAVRAGLERHFTTLRPHAVSREMDHAAVRSSIATSYEHASFDCVVLDERLGSGIVTRADRGAGRLLEEIGNVLRKDGCVCIPVTSTARLRPAAYERFVKGAGYQRLRSFYVYESLERPVTLIPVHRRSAGYFEVFAWGAGRGWLRGIISAVGMHRLLHRTMLLVAYR